MNFMYFSAWLTVSFFPMIFLIDKGISSPQMSALYNIISLIIALNNFVAIFTGGIFPGDILDHIVNIALRAFVF